MKLMAQTRGEMARAAAVGISLFWIGCVGAQELEPGAYSPSPAGVNIVVAGFTHNTGDLSFDPSGPITEANATINSTTVGYLRTLGIAGRLANIGFGMPYARGDIEGLVFGQPAAAHRSAWGDPRLRLAINLAGVPAMTPKEYAAYRPSHVFGTSLTVSIPTGQYDSARLINVGNNRWAFKPELGYARYMGKWSLEGAVGAWFYTDNTEFYGGKTKEQDPIGSFQFHVIYTFRPRMWLGFDANYYTGGRTYLDGAASNDLQKNSRMGLTFAMPISRVQSLKFSFSRGAVTNIGADFNSFGMSWQAVWW